MLSIVCITTPQDFRDPHKWQAMLSSLPQSSDIEVVTLINTVGAAEDVEPVLQLDYCSPESKINVRIYEAHYRDCNLGRMRNDATRLASHDWCMWMDADDAIVYGDPLDVVRSAPPSVGGYICNVTGMQSISGKMTCHYSAEQLRLWRRSSGAEWIGHAHEILDTARIKQHYHIGYADIVVHHAGYVTSVAEQRQRLRRNIRGVFATLVEQWDRDDVREHYLHVLARDVDMYHQLGD